MTNITAILNVYRRPQNLTEQVKAIRNQTIKPKEIWAWVNYHEDNATTDFSDGLVDVVVKSSKNFKYHGRFALGLLAPNDHYLAYFDDDTIPGERWFENCLTTIQSIDKVGICGSAGVILQDPLNYVRHSRVGWPSKNISPVRVDLVGHAWFLRRGLLNAMWAEPPISLDNGEDIQLSYMAQKMGFDTYCPPHPPTDKTLWGSIKGEELGIDEVASSTGDGEKHIKFMYERSMCVAHSIYRGWKTVLGLRLDK